MKNVIKIIECMEKEKLPVRIFISNHSNYFKNMPIGSLIAPECRKVDKYSEKAYIFLIGSYIYFRSKNKPVTWFERRRFANIEKIFQRTICCCPEKRFNDLHELKKFILDHT